MRLVAFEIGNSLMKYIDADSVESVQDEPTGVAGQHSVLITMKMTGHRHMIPNRSAKGVVKTLEGDQ